MPYTFRKYYIPDRMMESLERYIKDGIVPGSFLYAVLCGNLFDALARADDENLFNLPAFAAYLYNEVPIDCYGSPEKVLAWSAAKTLERSGQ